MVLTKAISLSLAVGLFCLLVTVDAKKGKCSEWQKSPCQPKRGNCGSGFQQGTRTGDCKGTKERRFKCSVPCAGSDANLQQREAAPSLEALEHEVVAESKHPPIRPGRDKAKGGKNKGRKKDRRSKGGNKQKKNNRNPCKYDKGTPSACDPTLKLITQVLTLKKGDPRSCEVNKTITLPCEGCSYGKSKRMARGECNEETNTFSMTMVLKSGNPEDCAATWTVTRKCNKKNNEGKQGRTKREKKEKRQQKKQQRQERKRQRKQERKAGRKNKGNKKENKRNKGCRYNKGEWSGCDAMNQMQRIDSLAEDSAADCQPTKTLTKQCRISDANKCRYGKRTLGECVDGKVTVTSQKESGPDSCAPTKSFQKSCGKCIFDKWGEFGACQNGVKTKKREVLQGGEKCQRRAVRMRKCKA